MDKKKFAIVDALALAYKAYFAFISRPLRTKDGEATSAVYGFMTQLMKILEDIKPDYIAVAFDSKEKTFRHERYEGYKSSRAEMPEDMIPQIQRIMDIINAMKIPVWICPGYEADDIMGTAVKLAEKEGLHSYIISPDKDLVQLVTENINVIKPGKSTEELDVFTKEKVITELGFEPGRMKDYLALVGDSSDDIPGVAGIGPKSALPLIQKYGTVEDIYAHIDEIESSSIKKKLEASRENAFLSKELATIHFNVPIEFNFENAKLTPPDYSETRKIFNELEFRSLYERLRKFYLQLENNEPEETTIEKEIEVINKEAVKYILVRTVDEAKKLADKLSQKELFVFDTETDSLNTLSLNLAGVSFSYKENEAYFVAINPFKENEGLFHQSLEDRLDKNEFVKIFKPVFEDEKIKKVCQNGKYDIAVLRSHDIRVKNFYFDTMIASYILDPDQKHSMDELALKYLNYKPIALTELIGLKKDPSKIFETDVNRLSDYSAEDADVTLKLYNVLSKEIEKYSLQKLCYEVEFPLVEVLEDMEREGIRVDKISLKQFSGDLETLMDNYTRKIYEAAGESFNINSPQQMQKILFDKLKLKTGKKTKTGFSTDARSLENLKGEHEIIDYILDYRQAAKLKSTYADALQNLIEPITGRVHTSFNQTVASTGRLSSNEPNLQNIPIRTEMGKEIRKAFVPRNKDYVILSVDYSQIELRIMASICEDETLITAFKNNEDIHRRTAALVFGVAPEEVTPDMRRKAKEVNFGILYGIGAFGLKTRLGISQNHAADIINTYFNSFSKIKSYMDNAIKSAKEKGYAETLLGRRRFLKNINSSNFTVRNFEERAAINMPIQGTAADMIKIAMINIWKELNKRKAKTKMVLQVHDELVFDAHKDELEELKPVICQLMENALPLNVPVKVDTGIGDNWLDAH